MGSARVLLSCVLGLFACGDDGGAPATEVTTEHCEYRPLAATSGAGGTVTAGTLEAGAAEAFIDAPVGSALGAYTARAGFLGSSGTVDLRKSAVSGNFNPSIGIETAPRVRAVALTAGSETVILMNLDLGAVFEGMIFDLEERLGDGFSGKVLISASHTHSGWGHFTGHSAYQMGFGVLRQRVYDAMLDVVESTARAALAARRPAKLGVFADMNFDPDDVITRDRRGENNDLMGGPRKDDAFFLIRVDGTDDLPIALIPIYGVHGTLNGEDNSLAATDSIGGMERLVEEQFDRPVVVMHLQGAGGDVSPRPYGSVDCSVKPGADSDPCFSWLQGEAHGRAAVATMMAAWEAAGQNMQSSLALEMLTRSIEQGPYPETFTLREGALSYAPFEPEREADGLILDGNGAIVSPIDEFNAPVGAGLCEKDEVMFGAGTMPGTDDLFPYGSCARVGAMGDIFEILLDTQFESDDRHPICQSTRTLLSALRLGDYVIGTIPGELTVMLADYVREGSPVAPDKTIVVGYAQGHQGYLLTPEDWILGGYESSINIWGPLEGEYVANELVKLLPLATTEAREDGGAGGIDRYVAPAVVDALPIDDPAPMAGTVPNPVPDTVWVRTGSPVSAQPTAQVERVSGVATFVWIGDDPLTATPVVTVEREVSTDTWEPLTRRSGRVVHDGAVVLGYTPLPVRREGSDPQTHYWVAEFQAVPPVGGLRGVAADLSTLEARAGLPLGRYRFRVQGKAFDLTSDAFEVVAANLGAIVTRTGSVFAVAVSLHAPRGYRLLDMEVASNTPVPVRAGDFTVTLEGTAGPAQVVTIGADGTLTIDAGVDADSVTGITLVDAYGNSRTVTVP